MQTVRTYVRRPVIVCATASEVTTEGGIEMRLLLLLLLLQVKPRQALISKNHFAKHAKLDDGTEVRDDEEEEKRYFIAIIFHNLRGYDAHHIIRHLKNDSLYETDISGFRLELAHHFFVDAAVQGMVAVEIARVVYVFVVGHVVVQICSLYVVHERLCVRVE